MITRRQFHQFSLGTAATVALSRASLAQTKRIIVDSQVHIWKPNTPDRPWSPEAAFAPQLPEPMSIERLMPLMDEGGVDRAIIVPPVIEGSRFDYGQEAARRYPGRFAIMSRPNINDPGDQARMAKMPSEPAWIGWRISFPSRNLSDGSTDWFWTAAEKLGQPVMSIAAKQTPFYHSVAERHPQLALIIDHIGVTLDDVKEGTVLERVAQTAALAKHPNVSVKLSAIPLFSKESYPWRDMNDHIKRLYDAFGPQRCHWGTDITNNVDRKAMFSTMKARVTHFTEELPFLSESDKDWIMGKSLMQKLKWT